MDNPAEPPKRVQFSIAELLTVTAVVSVLLTPCSACEIDGELGAMVAFGGLLLFLVGGGVGRVISRKKRGWVTGAVCAFFWTLTLCPTLGAILLAIVMAVGVDDVSFRVILAGCAVVSAAWGGYLAGAVEREPSARSSSSADSRG